MSTDTPSPQAVDYSGQPLTEGDTVAFISTDPVCLRQGRIRVIGPGDLCIESGAQLVLFNSVHAGWADTPARPLGGQTRRNEDLANVRAYPHVALQQTVQPAVREQKERPTHPDGTPYRHHEMVAEGWEFCDGCRTWSTATADDPHHCPGTHMSGPATAGPAKGGA